VKTPSRPKKFLDQVRDAIRRNHYSPRTEESYVAWIKRSMNHAYFLPRRLRKVQVEMSLSVLACDHDRAINILGGPQMVQALA